MANYVLLAMKRIGGNTHYIDFASSNARNMEEAKRDFKKQLSTYGRPKKYERFIIVNFKSARTFDPFYRGR